MSIDKSTLVWENLEYARLQVRILKNRNARLSKGMKINNQIFNIFIEEEIPSVNGNLCKCIYNGFGSSDSVSSSETYVEETEFAVNSCEEEVGQREGVVRWSKGEKNSGEAVEGGNQATQMTKKMVREESATKGIQCLINDNKSFTYKEMEVQKAPEESDFVNAPTCVVGDLGCHNHSIHDDMAMLVGDV